MARQQGNNPITGTIDGFSFYYNKEHGFLMRRKTGPTRKQVKTDSAFNLTRRNNSEFGRASSYGKLIRRGFHEMTRHCKDGTMNTRLSQRLREIMKMDNESEWGKRDLRKDNLKIFEHFEWDARSLSRQYFELPAVIKYRNGCLEAIAGISLKTKLKGADSWKLYSIAVEVDFVSDKVSADVQQSDVYAFEKGDFAESFTHYCKDDGVLFYGMCIVWHSYDATINDYKPLKGEHVNAGFIKYVER